MRMKKILVFILVFLCVIGMCSVSTFAESDTAAIMRIEKMQGSVKVTNYTGKTITKTKKMKLYNGYKIKTGAKSYVWISLDDTKVAKLDANSCVEVQKKDKKITLYLSSGNIFFNAKEPLKSNENLHIKTSTLAIGVRGTSGCVTVVNARVSEIDLLTGKLEIVTEHPVAGIKKTATMRPGQTATSKIDQEAMAVSGEMVNISIKALTVDDVCDNCAIEIADDPALAERIQKEAPQLQPSKIVESAEKKLAEDELADEEKQKAIDEAVRGQNLPKDVIYKTEEEETDSSAEDTFENTVFAEEFSDPVDMVDDVTVESEVEDIYMEDEVFVPAEVAVDMMEVCQPYLYDTDCRIYTDFDGESFAMRGNYYTSGLNFYSDSSYAEFDLGGKYTEMTFTLGHVDQMWTTANRVITFTVDGEVVEEIRLYKNQIPRTVTISLNNGSTLRIDCNGDERLSCCGLGNIMVR